MVPPVTSAFALMAKRPKPPPGSGFCPAQISVSRKEAASPAKVPSIFSVGLTLIAPSKAAFIGSPATRSFSPVRLPASAAAKSASVTVMSSGSSCQTKRPVAPKLLEIDGQASENATSSKVSFSLCAWSFSITVPPRMRSRRRRGQAARSASGCAPAPRSGRTSSSGRSAPGRSRWSGRTSETSAISTRPASSGKKRSRAVSRSAVSAGRLASPSATSSKLTRPVGNSLTVVGPRRIGLRPVTARISLSACSRTASGEIR